MGDDNSTPGTPVPTKEGQHPAPDGWHPKFILGLVGSPRRLGNCELITKEISRNITVPHRLNLIRLPSLSILPCNACYACIMDRPCPNKDDMQFLLRQIAEADAMIITSPVYFLGAHSIFKRILDRGFLLYTILEKTWGKPCILINMYGMEGRIGAAPHALMTFARVLGLDVKESLNLMAALPGEIVMEEEGKRKAKQLAGLLFSRGSYKNEHGCPFCGSEIVRMAQGRFICAVCHGHFSVNDEGSAAKIEEGGIFGSLDHTLKHREWLRGMKERFLANKKEIIRTISGYKNVGEWLDPE